MVNQVHQDLSQKYFWYNWWHGRRFSGIIHWIVLVVYGLTIFPVLSSLVNPRFSYSSAGEERGSNIISKPIVQIGSNNIIDDTDTVAEEDGQDYDFTADNNILKTALVKSDDKSAALVVFDSRNKSRYVRFVLRDKNNKEFKNVSKKNQANNKLELTVSADSDVSYTLENQKLKEEIIVKNRGLLTPSNSLGFTLNLNGLQAEEAGNNIDLIDSQTQELVFQIPRPTVVDANGQSGQIGLSLDAVNNVGTLTLDANFVQTAVYPLIIDPSVISFLGVTTGAGTFEPKERKLLRASSGTFVALYEDGSKLTASYSQNPTAAAPTWSSAFDVTTSGSSTTVAHFSAAMDASNNIYVAYFYNGTDNYIFHKKFAYTASPEGWTLAGSESTVESTNTPRYPTVIIDSSNVVWVGYQQTTTTRAFMVKTNSDSANNYPTGSWSTATAVSASVNNSAHGVGVMAIWNGSPVALYTTAANNTIAWSYYASGAWQTPASPTVRTINALSNMTQSSLTVSGSSPNQYLHYVSARSGIQYYQHDDSTSSAWSGATNLDTATSPAHPAITVDANRNLYAFWSFYVGFNQYQLVYKKATFSAGPTWTWDVNQSPSSGSAGVSFERAFDKVFTYNSSVFADVTTAAGNTTAADLTLLPANNDEVYFGLSEKFNYFYADLSTNGSVTGTWYYSTASGWTSFSPQDSAYTWNADNGRELWTFQSGTDSPNYPGDWAQSSVNGSTQYWVKFTASAVTTAPVGTQITAVRSNIQAALPVSVTSHVPVLWTTNYTGANATFQVKYLSAISLNTVPNTPSNSAPSNGATRVSTTPTLTSSAFSDPNAGDTHSASQWQITTTSGNYGSPVFDSGTDTTNKTSIAVSPALSEGTTYYWHVRHQDNNSGWSSYSSETSFTTDNAAILGYSVDNTLPSLSEASDGSGNVTITFKARDAQSDNVDIVAGSFQYSVNGGSWTAIADGSVTGTKTGLATAATFGAATAYTLTWTSQTELNNAYSSNTAVRFKVSDGVLQSGYGTSPATGFDLDNQKPTSAFTAPSAGATIGVGPYTVAGTSSDNSGTVSNVQIRADSGAYASVTNTGSNFSTWSYSWSGYSAGAHTLEARATDNKGNIQTSLASVSVTVDANLPTAQITSHQSGSVVKAGGAITLSGTAAANGGQTVTLVEISIDQGSFAAVTNTGTNYSSWNYAWSASGVTSGSHNLRLRATNSVNNQQSTDGGITVTADGTAPSSTITAPSNNGFVGDAVYSIIGTSSDLGGGVVSEVLVSVDGGNSWAAATNTGSNFSTWSYSWATPASGEVTIKTKALDSVGNQESAGAGNKTTIDKTPPAAFDLSEPTHNSWTAKTKPTLKWNTTTDALAGVSSYQIWIDDKQDGTATAPTTSFTLTESLADGSHTWFVKAVDNAGNIRSSTSTYTLKIDTTGPAKPATSLSATETYRGQENNLVLEKESLQVLKVDALSSKRTVTWYWQATLDSGVGLSGYQVEIKDKDSKVLVFESIKGGSSFTKSALDEKGRGGIERANAATITTSNSYSYTFDNDGIFEIIVKSIDLLGNLSEPILQNKILVDTKKPTAPENIRLLDVSNRLVGVYLVFADWSASQDDESGVKNYHLVINGKEEETTPNTFVIVKTEPSALRMTVRAEDRAGNLSNESSLQSLEIKDKAGEAPRLLKLVINPSKLVDAQKKTAASVEIETSSPTVISKIETEPQGKGGIYSSRFNTVHILALKDLKARQVYKAKVQLKDNLGNSVETEGNFTTQTPFGEQSVVEVILRAIENAFGFFKNVLAKSTSGLSKYQITGLEVTNLSNEKADSYKALLTFPVKERLEKAVDSTIFQAISGEQEIGELKYFIDTDIKKELTYSYRLASKNEILSFNPSGKDEIPPKISNLKTESLLLGLEKGEAIISLETDKPTSATLSLGNQSLESRGSNLSHQFIVKDLNLDQTHDFEVQVSSENKTAKQAGNLNLAAKPSQANILETIFKNLRAAFGWLFGWLAQT